MIYLIGVEHNKVQWKYEDGSNETFVYSFANSIKKHIKNLKVTVITEDLSEDVLEQQNVSKSTAQIVAREFPIKHIFCDPSKKEREDLGIPSYNEVSVEEFRRSSFPKIERFWLNSIIDLKGETILFICGKNHVENFKGLLEENGFRVTILFN
jgi:hypothetical protein